jgi:hypothetical protein
MLLCMYCYEKRLPLIPLPPPLPPSPVVAVVFRGAITRADWSHAGDFKTKRCDNPVSESYAGKEECLRIHRGFYMYLFRGRKDTFTTKYDEIATKGTYAFFSWCERASFNLINNCQ